jgi:hypothetical protein
VQVLKDNPWAAWQHFLFTGQFEQRPLPRFTCEVDYERLLAALQGVTDAQQVGGGRGQGAGPGGGLSQRTVVRRP